MTRASFFSICTFTPAGLTDTWISNLPICTLTSSSSTKSKYSSFQTFHLLLGTLGLLKTNLRSKYWGEKGASTLYVSFVNRAPAASPYFCCQNTWTRLSCCHSYSSSAFFALVINATSFPSLHIFNSLLDWAKSYYQYRTHLFPLKSILFHILKTKYVNQKRVFQTFLHVSFFKALTVSASNWGSWIKPITC